MKLLYELEIFKFLSEIFTAIDKKGNKTGFIKDNKYSAYIFKTLE